MITLNHDRLEIRFPEISATAGLRIDFQRTLRIPDDGQKHHLPPGLGRFPLRHIEDFDLGASQHRKARGGTIMPMFQTDALWLNFGPLAFGQVDLPVALKIGAGKINAVSGLKWTDGLTQDPQDYVVVPDQPWLDGFNVGKGVVRQFVAMPLGQGYTVEEQVDPDSDVGGVQIEAIPMKKALYDEICEQTRRQSRCEDLDMMMSCMAPQMDMGLGMGGSMRQEVYADHYGPDAWDLEKSQRCFVTLANAEQWMAVTGEEPPLSVMSAADYTKAGLPWFDYYDGDRKAIDGAKALGKIKSIKQLGKKRRDPVWPKDAMGKPKYIKAIGKGQVSDGSW